MVEKHTGSVCRHQFDIQFKMLYHQSISAINGCYFLVPNEAQLKFAGKRRETGAAKR